MLHCDPEKEREGGERERERGKERRGSMRWREEQRNRE